ncbi:MAG: flap endonuclease-1 [Candidatus Micrarchaeia archaeon]
MNSGEFVAVDIGKLISEIKKPVSFAELSGKSIAIDAYNTIYQFLSIIRQPDGMPLVDSKNRVTSHLSGLFYRTISFIENGITPIYVFDGIPSSLKQRTINARIKKREDALEAWNKAKEEGMLDQARSYAMASTRINKDIVNSAKELLEYMGVAYVQAPGEGEAQAAYMNKAGLVYASCSQDYDLFLLGAENIVRNLAISGKRKLPRKNVYVNVEPEIAKTKDLLEQLGITQRQLIMLGILIGTDFNTGIEKVGPKTALKLVRENSTVEKLEHTIKEKYNFEFDVPIEDVIKLFEEPEVKELSNEEFEAIIKNCKPDKEKLVSFMCDEYGFSKERISSNIKKLLDIKNLGNQKGINSWL